MASRRTAGAEISYAAGRCPLSKVEFSAAVCLRSHARKNKPHAGGASGAFDQVSEQLRVERARVRKLERQNASLRRDLEAALKVRAHLFASSPASTSAPSQRNRPRHPSTAAERGLRSSERCWTCCEEPTSNEGRAECRPPRRARRNACSCIAPPPYSAILARRQEPMIARVPARESATFDR